MCYNITIMGRPKHKTKLRCPVCDKEFERYAYDVKRGAKYCSIRCHHQTLKKVIPYGVLEFLYIQLKYSLKKISIMLGCSDITIKSRIIEAGIKLRSRGESQALGQKGKKHSRLWNRAIAKGHRNMSPEKRLAKVKRLMEYNLHHPHPPYKGGKRADLGGLYFRSRSEANYARFLNLLIKNKTNGIARWEFEPDTFEFTKIKRGTRFYTPDFKLFYNDGHIEYREVKGWDYPKGKTARKRFAKYFPHLKLVLIGDDFFKSLKRQGIAGVIPNWE